MRIANPFRYAFRKPYQSITCVYKCWFGKKYVIFTAKSLHKSINQMAVELDRRLRLGVTEDCIYYKVVKHILRARVGIFEVEVIDETENALAMLKSAYKALRDAKKDPNCLNMSFEPHVAQWVTIDDKTSFETWVKRYGQPVKKKKALKPKINAKKA